MNDAYAAGLFDGEGHVRIAHWQKPGSIHIRSQLIVGIGMTYLPVIEALQRTYDGSINQNRHDLRNPKHRIQYTWHIASHIAARFLQRVSPFLIVKREEVELALEFQRSVDKYRFQLGNRFWLHPQRGDIITYRDNLARRISDLKHRTFPPLFTDGPIDDGQLDVELTEPLIEEHQGDFLSLLDGIASN